jgi:uncharacterized protein (TIGR03118 family)
LSRQLIYGEQEYLSSLEAVWSQGYRGSKEAFETLNGNEFNWKECGMKPITKFVAIVIFAVLAHPNLIFAQHYTETVLVSNFGTPPVPDSNLQNAWGLVASPTSPWWVSNNAGGTSTLYDATGLTLSPPAVPPVAIVPINGNGIVTIPSAPSQNGALGSPTGVMFNGNAAIFHLPSGSAAHFIFVTEDGTVQAWAGGPSATIVADNSIKPDAANGAVYKGATIVEIDGKEYILAANFRSGRVDVFDSTFKQVHLGNKGGDGDDSRDAFDDESIPEGFAPFNIQGIGPNIYITYAKQDAPRHDPVGGEGLGFVDVFTREGRRLQRLQHGPWFNAPWGVVLTPSDFGEFSHTILVGNFRGGTIAAFNPITGRFMGNVLTPGGSTLNIDGLWALKFGNGNSAGPAQTLFFTAGPHGEKDGLFGTLTPIASELGEADEQ